MLVLIMEEMSWLFAMIYKCSLIANTNFMLYLILHSLLPVVNRC